MHTQPNVGSTAESRRGLDVFTSTLRIVFLLSLGVTMLSVEGSPGVKKPVRDKAPSVSACG